MGGPTSVEAQGTSSMLYTTLHPTSSFSWADKPAMIHEAYLLQKSGLIQGLAAGSIVWGQAPRSRFIFRPSTLARIYSAKLSFRGKEKERSRPGGTPEGKKTSIQFPIAKLEVG